MTKKMLKMILTRSKTDENIEKIRNLDRSDSRLSIFVIAETAGSDKECVRQILHNNLYIQKWYQNSYV